MKKLLIPFLFLISFYTLNSQTTLAAGDIAFLGIGTDDPDKYAFILLKDIVSGTVIKFTDNTWLNGTALATNESTSTWTADMDLPLGTVIKISAGPVVTGGGSATGDLNGLAAAGDQILAYQGTVSSPSFIAAISSENFIATCNTTNNTNTSCLPSPLVDGTNAISLTTTTTEVDNGYYNGIVSGTVSEILAAINNRSNWVTSDLIQTFPTWSFALPVELMKFSAQVEQKKHTLLSFATASERNNARFEIERSADGRDFSAIGEVKGAGDAQVQHNYSFTDEHPMRGINYYRLRQVDFDGASTLSQVVSVTFGKTGNVVLYPTPASETMNVRFDEAFTTDANWQIVDLTGRILNEGIFAAEQVEFRIPVASLTQGAYILRVTANNEVVTQQFRKQ